MASQRQESQGRNTDPAMMNIPSLNIPYTPQINGWIEHTPGNVHDRLVQYALAGLQPRPSSHSSQPPRSTRSASSMTPALLHQSPAALPSTPPSLSSGTAPTTASTASTASSSSISTTLIDHGLLASYPILDDIDGVLVHPHLLTTPSPLYRCIFWFLSCNFLSRNRQEWETHSRAHFHGADPPRSVTCPLCDWATSCGDDAGPPAAAAAWHAKMAHLAENHFAFGQGLATARPDFHLFQHLWQKRLIGDEDLKELKGGNYGLARRRRLPLGNFVSTNGRGPRREREGNVGAQTLQHVSQGR